MFYIENIPETYSKDYPRIIPTVASFLIISAVTGVGKSTVRENILNASPIYRTTRVFTTRKERNRQELRYNQFGTSKQFSGLAKNNQIFCYCKWQANNEIYALLVNELCQFNSDDIVVSAFDLFGSALKDQNPEKTFNIWLTCENKDILKQRLLKRGTESSDEVMRRYSLAIEEQNFVLEHKANLYSRGKIDYLIDTSDMNPIQIAQEILGITPFLQ